MPQRVVVPEKPCHIAVIFAYLHDRLVIFILGEKYVYKFVCDPELAEEESENPQYPRQIPSIDGTSQIYTNDHTKFLTSYEKSNCRDKESYGFPHKTDVLAYTEKSYQHLLKW